MYPDAELLSATVVGGGSRKRRRAAPPSMPVQVRVVHGNLAFAAHPVAVGHYAGDSIVSAERQLDSDLANALSRRHQLGIYPGAAGTSAVFVNPKLASSPQATPRGAVIVGLGIVGSLSAASLTNCFARSLLEYVSKWSEYEPQYEPDQPAPIPHNLGISTLLIGAGDGGITVADSVTALLRGVLGANRALANARNPYRIDRIEFIELFDDRAVQAVKVFKSLESRVFPADAFTFDGVLHSGTGGWRSLSFEGAEPWWQRLQILGAGSEGQPGDGTLRFSASSRRARSEVRLLPTQVALVDQFVKASIRSTRDNRAAAKTLFELLLPNELKQQAPDQDDLVLILDKEAAHYPWELLEDPKSPEGKPWVVERGLLRQMESTRFRETVQGVTDNTALVIGDPVSQFPELEGAQEEARTVARVLESESGFQVERRIRPITEQFVNALFERPYKVLHLAGHGVYRYTPEEDRKCSLCGQPQPADHAGKYGKPPRQLTGMIIGDDLVLSPREVKQMRSVPELVFINCCHLGLIEPGDDRDEKVLNLRDDYNLIAANVATEFIEMGVRAVIAAGWAVDDEAAKTFALTFYSEMLRGQSFGNATLRARKETFDRHPRTNTWGAYQCYGDPDYRLIHRRDESEDRPGEQHFVSAHEAIVKLNNLSARLTIMAGKDTRKELLSLEGMEKAIQVKGWLDRGQVCAALGQAYGEAKCFEQAIKHYRQALGAKDSRATLKDIEQLANFEIRHAVKRWEAGDETRAVLEQLTGGILRLESLFQSAGFGKPAEGGPAGIGIGKTVERLCLLGSAYKRRAWISEPDRAESLTRMAQYYREAFELGERDGKFDCHPLLNWLMGELARDWQRGHREPKARERVPEYADLLARTNTELTAALTSCCEFLPAVMQVDAQLIKAMIEERLEGAVDCIAECYREAKKLASPGKFEAVLDQVDFLIQMSRGRPPLVKTLTHLRRKLD
ncbi:MAG: CHAT domain-containing protein [Rubrivivax sp.]|nr:CHAT domain-containing protein [Rubrivivax sp.]